MHKPICKTCPYWEKESASDGWCIRFPPIFNPHKPDDDDERNGSFPMTIAIGSCGEHPDFPAYIEFLRMKA